MTGSPDQVSAEDLVYLTDERFLALLDTLPFPAFVVIRSGLGASYNAALTKYVGFLPGPGIADRAALHHQDDRPALEAARAAAVETDQSYTVQARLLRHDGAYRWHRIHNKPLFRDGRRIAYLGTAVDVHDERLTNELLEQGVRNRTAQLHEANSLRQELAEQMLQQEAQNEILTQTVAALRESEALYRLSEARLERAQDIAGVGSWEVDVTTGHYTWSKALYRMRGVTEPGFELNFNSVSSFVHEEDRDALRDWLASLIAGNTPPPHEYRVLDPQGNVRHVRSEGKPMFDTDGTLLRIEGTSQDITERRQIERQLAQAQKLDALGNLTGGMAHDFNNILGIITANIEMLQQEVEGNETASELCGEALEGANRCADLIRSLLAFARRQSLNPEPTQVNGMVQDITRLLRRTLGEDITVTLHLERELWPVIVDSAQLESCLVNLANNARDAMPKGGHLDVTTQNTQIDASYLALQPDVTIGDYVLLEVSDTGIGIPPGIISHIFEPFFTTKAPAHGTGLGLSMAFGFVKQSGGHMSVYSEPGLGTTFRIYLPRNAPGGVVEPSAPPLERVVGGDEIVLVVEDNAQLRRAVARQLAELGYRVREADCAAAALVILSSDDDLDLLFTDVVMPGTVDGLDLANTAKGLRPGIKILITSGFLGARGGEARSVGSQFKFIGKPSSRSKLATAIRDCLDSE